MKKKSYEKKEPIKVPRFKEKNGFYTTANRSRLMSKIKGKDTKPEIMLRKSLWHAGLRYKKNLKGLPGKPDIFISKHNIVVFIDGEFWHGYNWEEKKEKIKSNPDFWIPKIERNIQRDLENNEKLKDMGLTVIRFWEHEVKQDLGQCVNRVLKLVDPLN